MAVFRQNDPRLRALHSRVWGERRREPGRWNRFRAAELHLGESGVVGDELSERLEKAFPPLGHGSEEEDYSGLAHRKEVAGKKAADDGALRAAYRELQEAAHNRECTKREAFEWAVRWCLYDPWDIDPTTVPSPAAVTVLYQSQREDGGKALMAWMAREFQQEIAAERRARPMDDGASEDEMDARYGDGIDGSSAAVVSSH